MIGSLFLPIVPVIVPIVRLCPCLLNRQYFHSLVWKREHPDAPAVLSGIVIVQPDEGRFIATRSATHSSRCRIANWFHGLHIISFPTAWLAAFAASCKSHISNHTAVGHNLGTSTPAACIV